MAYDLLFDAGRQPPNFVALLAGIFSLGLGLAMWRLRDARPRFIIGWLILSAAMTVAGVFQIVGDRSLIANARAPGGSALVEGTVDQFVAQTFLRKRPEHFVVRGVPFQYSWYDQTSFFRESTVAGGPLRAGVHVRIHYIYVPLYRTNEIVRLEIRHDDRVRR